MPLGATPTAVPSVRGLEALNIDPEAAARAYRERIVGPYRGKLPDSAITSIEEQLSGACTVEIAAFDEFAKLLGNADATGGFDHVIFDTAPTGHTLRLLSLPAAWTGYLQANPGAASCLGPLGGLQAQRSLYEATVRALSDRQRHHARTGRAARAVGAHRSGAYARRAGRARRAQSAAGRKRPVHRERPRRSGCAGARSPRKRGAWRDAGGIGAARADPRAAVVAQSRRSRLPSSAGSMARRSEWSGRSRPAATRLPCRR